MGWHDEENVSELAKIRRIFRQLHPALGGEDVRWHPDRSHRHGRIRSRTVVKVRAALLQRQRDFLTGKGLVADGRDTGSVVFLAELKELLTAESKIRAERRAKQIGIPCEAFPLGHSSASCPTSKPQTRQNWKPQVALETIARCLVSDKPPATIEETVKKVFDWYREV